MPLNPQNPAASVAADAGADLGSGWQDKPTTDDSFTWTIRILAEQMSADLVAKFRAWYAAARVKDPKITPDQAVAAWLTGTTLQKGAGDTGALLGQVPVAAAQGAEKAVESFPGAGLLSEVGTLLHGIAEALDWVFTMFAPGQGWRIAFGAGAVVTGVGAARSYLNRGSFPVSVGLSGVSLMFAFMALRSWPQEGGGPEKPGEYIVQILTGHPPAAGPQQVHHVGQIEAGLAGIVGLWAASKVSQSIGNVIGAFGVKV